MVHCKASDLTARKSSAEAQHMQLPISGSFAFSLKLARFLLVFPGNLKFDSSTGEYYVKPERIRKIAALGFHTYYLYVTVTHTVLPILLGSSSGDALLYCLMTVVWMVTITAYLVACFNVQGFASMLNSMRSLEAKLLAAGFVTPSQFYTKHLTRIFVVAYTVGNLWFVLGDSVTLNGVGWTLETLRATAVMRTEILNGYIKLNASMVQLLQPRFSWMVGIKAAIAQIFIMQTSMVESCNSILGTVSCTSSFFLTRTFVRRLKTSHVFREVALELADDVLELYSKINEVVGLVIFYLAFSNLPYYALGLRKIFGASMFQKIYLGYYMCALLMALIPAAVTRDLIVQVPRLIRTRCKDQERCALTTMTRTKKTDMESFPTDRKFDMIAQEISNEETGIRGKVFTVSFSLIGHVCSLILTYAIIMYQFSLGTPQEN